MNTPSKSSAVDSEMRILLMEENARARELFDPTPPRQPKSVMGHLPSEYLATQTRKSKLEQLRKIVQSPPKLVLSGEDSPVNEIGFENGAEQSSFSVKRQNNKWVLLNNVNASKPKAEIVIKDSEASPVKPMRKAILTVDEPTPRREEPNKSALAFAAPKEKTEEAS